MSKKYAVDANLIRAIIYMESTHGYYDAPLDMVHLNKSIRPMNVNTTYWGNAWGSSGSLADPRSNIEGGTQLLKAILNAMPGADIAKVATIYNNTDAKRVSDYGARVKAIYESKAWAAPPALPSTGTIRLP
jgi:soluble lytic murein transglycosylase-like protein